MHLSCGMRIAVLPLIALTALSSHSGAAPLLQTQLPAPPSMARRAHAPDGRLDIRAATFQTGAGKSVSVYEAGNLTLTHAEVRVLDGHGSSRLAQSASRLLVASPSRVRVGGVDYLYTVEADHLHGPAQVWRYRHDEGRFVERERVHAPGLRTIDWPRFATVGQWVVAAHRDSYSRPSLMWSADGGRSFSPSAPLGDVQGAMAEVAAMGDGRLVYTYQQQGNERGSRMTALFQVLSPTNPPTPARAVSDTGPNVHDTAALLRKDGGVDFYYSSAVSSHGFSLFRRALSPDGRLGPETLLVAHDAGDLTKSSPTRLTDGSVLLHYAEISQRDRDLRPAEQILGSLHLAADEPAP